MRGRTCKALASVVVVVALAPAAACGRERAGKPHASEPALAFTRGFDAIWLLGRDWSIRSIGVGSGPRWSADGRELLFRDRTRLVVYDLATGSRRALARTDPFSRADWSPAGHMIAYVSPLPGSDYELVLWVVDPTRGSPTRIAVVGNSRDELLFAWSPDGKRLAYVPCEIVGPGSHGETDCQILIANVHGGRKRRVLRRASIGSVAWSPDGRAIAITAALRSGPEEGQYIAGSSGTYVLEFGSGQLKRVLLRSAAGFAWSPDSRWLACTLWNADTGGSILLVSRDGHERKVIAKPTDDQYGYSYIAWSTRGGLIAVAHHGLLIIDPETGRIVHRTHGDDRWPAWRPR
jgi:Tol biopolymer transport system component